jgi:hypothetical protein
MEASGNWRAYKAQINNVGKRLDRIERRLDLSEAPTG